MSNFRYIGLLVFALLWSQGTMAQSKKRQELEARKVRIMDEIELANRILAETKKDRSNTLGTIETVQQKIKLREKLIRTLDREVELMEEEEAEMQRDIDTLRVRVEKQKAQYAHMIQQAYKSRKNSSRLMFILSSEDFNQAMRRIEYLKQYSAYRQQKIKEIEKQELELGEAMERLRVQKVRKNAVRGQLQEENRKLSNEKLSQEEAIKTYAAMEKDLEKKLKEKLKEAAKVEAQIEKVIAEEIAKARALAARKALEDRAIDLGLIRGKDFSSNTTNSRLEELIDAAVKARAAENKPAIAKPESFELTPAARTLAANFEANQKRLPWPVERGLVTGNFGPQRHPVVKSVIIDSKGIDITTQENTPVKAVFNGTVTRRWILPNGQIAVVISHGNYFSVYLGIKAASVDQGDTVKAGQSIGITYTNPINSQTMLHFQLWKDNQAVNPLLWLSSK